MLEENKNNNDEKENSVNFNRNPLPKNSASQNQKGKTLRKRNSRNNRNNDFIDDEDDENDEDGDIMEFEANDEGESVSFNKKKGNKIIENRDEMLRERPKRNVAKKKNFMEIEEEDIEENNVDEEYLVE